MGGMGEVPVIFIEAIPTPAIYVLLWSYLMEWCKSMKPQPNKTKTKTMI